VGSGTAGRLEMAENKVDVRAFWNSRAAQGFAAGTRDVIAKKLEIEAISGHVTDGMRILDVGCGNGITAIELARRYSVRILGIDFAEEMIAEAIAQTSGRLKGPVEFRVLDARNLAHISEKFDLIYTERFLINLPDWPAQKQAIVNIASLLADGGLYVMCENSQDGLDRINSFRERVGLSKINAPWHNRYLRNSEIEQMKLADVELEDVNDFSSTYYFLSRVVNAWLASQNGKEPNYESPVNQLALKLPAIGNLGQTKIWVWRRTRARR